MSVRLDGAAAAAAAGRHLGAVGSGIKHLGKKMEKRARGMGQTSADGLSAQLCVRDQPSNGPTLPWACLSICLMLPGTYRCWVVLDGLEATARVSL
jgi:FAD/FMN-containing dehydrogenase